MMNSPWLSTIGAGYRSPIASRRIVSDCRSRNPEGRLLAELSPSRAAGGGLIGADLFDERLRRIS
jgi:hypothetical protein